MEVKQSKSEYISKWIRSNRSRIALTIFIFYWSLPFLLRIPYIIIENTVVDHFVMENEAVRVAYATGTFIIATVTLAVAAWFSVDILPNVAGSLGYSRGASINLEVSGQGHNISLPSINEEIRPEGQILLSLTEKYDVNSVLSPLDIARFRLIDHINKLRNNSVTNLFIGVGIAILGVAVLFTALFQVDAFYDQTKHEFNVKAFLLIAIAPKLSITLFIQIFSYFFLAMYRSNQGDIRFFQNEITLIDSFACAVAMNKIKETPANSKIILTSLVKNERNRLMTRNQKAITATDEAEFIKSLSALLDSKLGQVRL